MKKVWKTTEKNVANSSWGGWVSRKASWNLKDVQSFKKKARESILGQGSSACNRVYKEPAIVQDAHVLTFHDDWNTE